MRGRHNDVITSLELKVDDGYIHVEMVQFNEDDVIIKNKAVDEV